MFFGILFAYLTNSIIAYLFFTLSQEISSYNLHYSAIILAICLGFFIPIISNYLPIRRALSKTLRDSLDLYHRNVNNMNVTILKLEKMGISISQTVISMTLIIMGVMCYYFAPQAFLSKQIELFLAFLNITLMMLIIGLTLLLSLL